MNTFLKAELGKLGLISTTTPQVATCPNLFIVNDLIPIIISKRKGKHRYELLMNTKKTLVIIKTEPYLSSTLLKFPSV